MSDSSDVPSGCCSGTRFSLRDTITNLVLALDHLAVSFVSKLTVITQ